MTSPDTTAAKTTTPSPEQRAKVRLDHEHHSAWLRRHAIIEAVHPLQEVSYTGLIQSALLDPGTAISALKALLAGLPVQPDATPVLASAYSPSSMVDLVVPMQCGACTELLIVEHKRYRSPSNAPGYRTNPDAAWQTDQAYEGATGQQPAPWLYGDLVDVEAKTYIVLDIYGRPMGQSFYDGEHNDKWTVTSYAQFGAVLRAEHERGVPHLVPLLSALYMG